jgi:RepB DNA-primase N-terminal domain
MSESATELRQAHATARLPTSAGVAEASVMLDLFEGLGVQSINLTVTDETGRKVAFKRHRAVESLRTALPGLLLASFGQRLNVIVRPLAPHALSLIQLDDLTSSQVDRVRAMSFLVLETSPGNFQAWLAAQDADAETVRRVKKAAGADPNASGATRLAGSYNFKSKYAPNYPRVILHAVAPGRVVTVKELQHSGLIGPEQCIRYASRHAPSFRTTQRLLEWPSYSRCLADAPNARNHEGKDRSAADFEFCLISIDRGWSVEATANQLMAASEKAKAVGYNYALFTAKRAASIVINSNGR